ncbi:hypothetical protein DPMN_089383 [Dreissena polymorpha]|uniref:Uncharacterized protein n=1 Tax=Dreissena polymorpha TaxID=45954 RepID=A0A9D4KVV6_DREPO|nr:hypothetical protein DPMN_089383 [Dreissena polymorpha]
MYPHSISLSPGRSKEGCSLDRSLPKYCGAPFRSHTDLYGYQTTRPKANSPQDKSPRKSGQVAPNILDNSSQSKDNSPKIKDNSPQIK